MTSEPIVLTRALIKLILSLFCLVISPIFESLFDNSTKNSPNATAESVSNFSANFPKPLKSVPLEILSINPINDSILVTCDSPNDCISETFEANSLKKP